MSIGLTNPKISIKLYSKSKRFDDEEESGTERLLAGGRKLHGNYRTDLGVPHEKCGVCLALTGNEVNRNTIN